MEQPTIFNDNLKYFVNESNLISMRGKSNKWTPFMHAYNTYLDYYWRHFFSGSYWTLGQFMQQDLQNINRALINLFNCSEDSMTIAHIQFINGLAFISEHHYFFGKITYPSPMTYFSENTGEPGLHPLALFEKICNIINYKSLHNWAMEELANAGLPSAIIL